MFSQHCVLYQHLSDPGQWMKLSEGPASPQSIITGYAFEKSGNHTPEEND